jgi:hypothetical protein
MSSFDTFYVEYAFSYYSQILNVISIFIFFILLVDFTPGLWCVINMKPVLSDICL